MKHYEIRKVLVPIDSSGVARNALETAIELCKSQSAKLTIMHVIENPYAMFRPETATTVVSILSELAQISEDRMVTLTRELSETHAIPITHVVKVGNPADEVCGWAKHNEVDLIVTGTHGVSGLREFFIGSNAYRVVKNASCPVITIPEQIDG